MCGHECDCDCHKDKTKKILVPWMRCLKCDCQKCSMCSSMIPKIILDLHIESCHTAVMVMPLPTNFSDHSSRYQPAA